jgi:hypothetical protein
MGKASKYFIVSNALHLLHTAAAIYIIVVVPWKLYNVKLSLNASNPSNAVAFSSKCLLDPGTTSKVWSGERFCVAITAFAVVALLFSSVISLLKCCCGCITGNAFKLSHFITIVGDVVLAVMWGILFSTLLPRANAAKNAGYPRQGLREGTVIAVAVAAISMILDVFVNIIGIVKGVSS